MAPKQQSEAGESAAKTLESRPRASEELDALSERLDAKKVAPESVPCICGTVFSIHGPCLATHHRAFKPTEEVERGFQSHPAYAEHRALAGDKAAPERRSLNGPNVAPGAGRYAGLPDAPRVAAGGEPIHDDLPPVENQILETGEAAPPAIEPPIRTNQIPLSELPRCIVCREFVGPVFRVVDFHVGVVNPDGVRHVAGLAMAHKLPLGLAEIFATEPPPINISDDPRVDDRAIYCSECFAYSEMPAVMELVHRRAAEARRKS